MRNDQAASPTSNGCAGCLEDFLKQGENDRVGTYESVHGTFRTLVRCPTRVRNAGQTELVIDRANCRSPRAPRCT
jgi:hypothetical protein